MKKFEVAFKGLLVSLKHKAVIIQFINMFLAIVAGIILRINYYEWIVFIVLFSLVISIELINTCIEKICDFINPEYHKKIGEIKDISSAAVLATSIGSLIIAIMVFINNIWR